MIVDLMALCDTILPGDDTGWPAASAALGGAPAFLQHLDSADIGRVHALARGIADRPPSSWPDVLKAAEAADAALFGRLVGAVYKAYYSAAAVQARLAAIAEAGPREPSAHVDPHLVARVLATRAGARRL